MRKEGISSNMDFRSSNTFSSFDLPVELQKEEKSFNIKVYITIGLIWVACAKEFVACVLTLAPRKMYSRSHAFRRPLEDLELAYLQYNLDNHSCSQALVCQKHQNHKT